MDRIPAVPRGADDIEPATLDGHGRDCAWRAIVAGAAARRCTVPSVALRITLAT